MAVVDRDLIGDSTHAYLIGIGGVGMSALARVLKQLKRAIMSYCIGKQVMVCNQSLQNINGMDEPLTLVG